MNKDMHSIDWGIEWEVMTRKKIIIVIERARYITRHETYRAVACTLLPGSNHERVSGLRNS
jgi:hypothetical protein